MRSKAALAIALSIVGCSSSQDRADAADGMPAKSSSEARMAVSDGGSGNSSAPSGSQRRIPISEYFQDEINQVDPSKHLVSLEDDRYREFEWSYKGLTITCGSPLACEYGASELLNSMGFRWYAPNPRFFKRPVRILTDLSAPKSEYWLPNNSVFIAYGQKWGGSNRPSRKLLTERYETWARLNGVAESAYPAGHRWGEIIRDPALAQVFAENPILLRPGRYKQTFNLQAIKGTPNWSLLVNLCAAHLLKDGFNQFNRTNFDPVDGDDNSSDLVFSFAHDVLLRVRAGTTAIGEIPALAGNPAADIGLYAYDGHSRPPTASYRPVYTQVALAYNSSGLTYDELIAGHGKLAGSVGIREYLDTEGWSMGRPLVNKRVKDGYVDRYNDFKKLGVGYTITENEANWLVNLVGVQQFIRKLKTGETVPQSQIISEISDDIFGGDQAVEALYAYWGSPERKFNAQTILQSFNYVSEMRDGWYKEDFKKLMVILYDYNALPAQQPEKGSGDPYPKAVSSLLGKVTAIRDDGIFDSYAFIRRFRRKLRENYPSLDYDAKPEPAWLSAPVEPTDADYAAAAAALRAGR